MGVYYRKHRKKKWVVQFNSRREGNIYLGGYATKEEAYKVNEDYLQYNYDNPILIKRLNLDTPKVEYLDEGVIKFDGVKFKNIKTLIQHLQTGDDKWSKKYKELHKHIISISKQKDNSKSKNKIKTKYCEKYKDKIKVQIKSPFNVVTIVETEIEARDWITQQFEKRYMEVPALDIS